MLAPFPSNNSLVGPSSSTTKKKNSIQEIYDVTERINLDDVNMFCLFSRNDPITFEEAYQEDRDVRKQ
jgi:hypothetical protein